METHEVFESPGEALLFLLGLALFAISFLVFLVWGMVFGASNRALVPVIAFGQIGILIEAAIEWRIARRLRTDQSWWRRAFGSDLRKVRKELWRLKTLRSAKDMVSRDVPGALQAVLRLRILGVRSIVLGVLLIGGSAVISLAIFDAR